MDSNNFVKKWTKNYYEGITSESFAKNVILAFVSGEKRVSVKWVGGKLEQWSASEKLKNKPEQRRQELLRVVNSYGYGNTTEILNELKRRKLI
jgi:urate oxidase